MEMALQGALVGLGIAVFLVAMEYFFVSKAARERAARYKRKPEIDEVGQRRLRSIASFALLIPPAFAAAFWILWG